MLNVATEVCTKCLRGTEDRGINSGKGRTEQLAWKDEGVHRGSSWEPECSKPRRIRREILGGGAGIGDRKAAECISLLVGWMGCVKWKSLVYVS